MAKKPTNWGMWLKALGVAGVICVGGPALTFSLMPTEEELFKKYNPELQKKSLETRDQRQQEFDDFVTKLKEYSKSDKPIWVLQAEDAKREKKLKRLQASEAREEERLRKETQRREMGLPPNPSK